LALSLPGIHLIEKDKIITGKLIISVKLYQSGISVLRQSV
jgi:hypothetical protein